MKKVLAITILALSSILCAQAQKKTFLDIFQAQLTGGINIPFTNTLCTKVGTSTSASSAFFTPVNEDFDINIAFKTDDHLSVGLGYEAAGQISKNAVVTRPADPATSEIELDSWQFDQRYPKTYGTYNYLYAQFNYSIINWYKKADWRPVLYFRIGASQNSDNVKRQAVVASDANDEIYPVNTWCLQTSFGVMLHKRIWKDLSAVLDVRESSFLISSMHDVNGYYLSRTNEKEILYHSGKIQGWLSANIGLSWNF